jgi:hypothetical protein
VPGPPPVEEDDASPVDPSVPDAELSAGQPVPKASANKPRKQTERLSMSRSPSRLRFCMSPTAWILHASGQLFFVAFWGPEDPGSRGPGSELRATRRPWSCMSSPSSSCLRSN